MVKHAQASRVGLRIARACARLEIQIEDDGIGLAGAAPRPGGANGFGNVPQRMLAIGGSAELSGRATGGTRLLLKTPLDVPG